jgi:hypothetical protein
MGKHNRGWVEIEEKNVADGLNGKIVDKFITEIVTSIKEKIGTEYQHAIWVGGDSYDDPGDVHVQMNDDSIVKIELKFSSKKGSGTNKNLGQGTFKKKINENIMGYQEYDISLGLREKRYRLIENQVGKEIKTAGEYCTHLRALRNKGDPIIEKIVDITTPGQESYAQYASRELSNYLDKVNALVHSILGTNILDSSHQDVLYCVVKNFRSSQQTLEFFDFTDLDKKITKVESVGKSIKFLNKSEKDVLRFSVNWKNICQGGATPSFNVFIGNAFKH